MRDVNDKFDVLKCEVGFFLFLRSAGNIAGDIAILKLNLILQIQLYSAFSPNIRCPTPSIHFLFVGLLH